MAHEFCWAAASAAQGFDVEAATRAYLDTLQGAARAKSDAYFEGGYWLPLWGALVTIVAYWLMLRFGWSAAWSCWAEPRDPAALAAAGALCLALHARRRGPDPALDDLRRFHPRASIWPVEPDLLRMDQANGAILLGVGLVTGAIFFAIIYAVIRNSPKRWWLWGTAATGRAVRRA